MRAKHAFVLCGLSIALAVFCATFGSADQGKPRPPSWLDEAPAADPRIKDTVRQSLPQDLQVKTLNLGEGEKLSIQEISRMAVAQSLAINIFRLDQASEREEIPIGDSLYDTAITVRGNYKADEEQPSSTILGSREVIARVDALIEKTLQSGTELSLAYDNARESTGSPFASLPVLYRNSFTFKLVQPFLKNAFGLVDRAKIRRIELDVRQFDYETMDLIERHVWEVRSTYWDLVFAHRNLIAKDRALGQAQEFLRTTQEKISLGLVEQQDVFAAEANVRIRVIEVLEAQTTLKNQQEELQVLLDLPSDMTVVPGTDPVFATFEISSMETLTMALEKRRDLKQMLLETERDDLRITIQRSEKLPQFDAEASWSSSGLDRKVLNAQAEIGERNHPTVFAGVTFSLPLENRLAKGQLEQAEISKRHTLSKIDRLKRNIGQDVRQSIRNLRLAASRVSQTQRIEILQRRKLEEETKAYLVGRSDSRTVIDYQEDLTDAASNAQKALVEYQQAKDTVLRSQHILLEQLGLTGEETS